MRSIIKIDEDKCVGCSLCVNACEQDALKLIDGKAKLISDEYCDGLGMCLPQCPTDAITVTETSSDFKEEYQNVKIKNVSAPSALRQWPIQLHLVREDAQFFKDSNILVAADCVPFTLNNFHGSMLDGKSLVMACPKLDETSSYIDKLANIFKVNNIKTITLAIMEVPCCGGLDFIVKNAIEKAGVDIPVKKIIVNLDGTIK